LDAEDILALLGDSEPSEGQKKEAIASLNQAESDSEEQLTRKRRKRVALSPSPRPSQKLEDLCPICLSEILSKATLASCPHYYCFPCIDEWVKTNNVCPQCRQPITNLYFKDEKGKPLVKKVVQPVKPRVSDDFLRVYI